MVKTMDSASHSPLLSFYLRPPNLVELSTLFPWSLTSLCILLATVISSFIWLQQYYLSSQPSIHGPKIWPILGSYREASLNFHRYHDWLLTFFSDSHRTFRLQIFSRRNLLTVDPACVEYMLKTNFQNYPKGDVVRTRLHDFLGGGIFNADGDVWKRHRKIASTEFSNRKLRDFSANAFREHALRLAGILDTAARLKQSVDLHDLFLRMTLDSICQVGFGVDMGSLCPSLPDVPFGKAFDAANEIITSRFVNPFWPLQRMLNLGKERQLKKEMNLLNGFTSDVIRRRRADMATKSEAREDFLSRFIAFNVGEAGGYTDEELRDAILNFVIAGRDTTAVTLAWFVYCVCGKPEVADRVCKETVEVLGLQGGRFTFTEVAYKITYEALNRMHYLHAALTETLRLHPAVPKDGKTALADDVLPDGTHVKRGDYVSYIPYSMGKMHFLWGEDALEFNPDRWLNTHGVFKSQSPFKFTAFQAGPRICLGKESAYLQMKMTIALLFHFFKFERVPNHVVHYRLMMVMNMAHGLLVHVSNH